MATMDSIFSRGIPIFSISLPWTVKKDSITIPPRHPLPDITGTSQDRPKSVPYPRLKNSKTTSKCQFTALENRKTKKNGPSGAPGPASASLWRAKRGTLPKLSTFLSQLKGEPFEEKTNFRKKVSQCRKTERGTVEIFKHPICCKISKKLKREPFGEKIFRKKSHNAEKLKGGPFGVFQHPFYRKTSKNWRQKIFIFGKKSHSAEKNWKGGPFGISNIHSVAKQQKNWRGDPLGENFFQNKSRSAEKQAGTGPSRRHIQGSKIAKRLPSVKNSFKVLENRKFFEFFFEKITF